MKNEIRWTFDTLPHLFTILLGCIITFLNSWIAGIVYILFVLIGMIWFWSAICTRCYAYGNPACPSGYGLISARLFKKREGDFSKAFKRNIISVAFQWFIPLGVGVYDAIFDTDPLKIIFLLIFILVAFVYLPLAAKKKGCDKCPQKKECPFKR
jgi:hypothetical protein